MPNIVIDDDEFDLDIETIDDDVELPDDETPEATAEPESESGTPSEKSESSGGPEAESKAAGDEEEGIESYSKRVQKRINKLTSKMREYEKETQYWKDRVSALEAKTAAKEIADYQSQVAWSTTELEKQLEGARVAKKNAIEEGDIDKQIKVDDHILELREQLAEKRRLANAAKEQAEKLQESPQKVTTTAQPTPPPDDLPSGTRQWLRANSWFMKGEHPRAAEMARALDAALQEEGYSPDDPAMYAELDKRLTVAFPRVAKEKAKSPPSPPKPRVAGSSADGQRGTETAPASTTNAKPVRKLTHDDLVKMKRYGFDPQKAEDRKSWLKRNDPL